VHPNAAEETDMHPLITEAVAAEIAGERISRARASRLLPRRRRRFIRRERRAAAVAQVAAAP
jgi:hypothetical protein